MHWREVLRRPIITEKSGHQSEINQYAFIVHGSANKMQIREAVELAWPNVAVAKVRIANMPAKRSRRLRTVSVRKTGYKKAIVTLKSGAIDLFEGV
jgi:large subunit ribosomal protein L23